MSGRLGSEKRVQLPKESTSRPDTLSKDAITMLRRVKRHILAEPKRIAMNEWVSRKGILDFGPRRGYPRCGTVACIGGWVEELHWREGGHERAGQVLGISYAQEQELFFNYQLVHAQNSQTAAHARAVARHIDRFIERYG